MLPGQMELSPGLEVCCDTRGDNTESWNADALNVASGGANRTLNLIANEMVLVAEYAALFMFKICLITPFEAPQRYNPRLDILPFP